MSTQTSPKNRTYLQSWLALPARTRLYISMGATIIGATGILLSDYLEKTALPVKKPSSTTQSGSTSSEFS